MMTVIMMMMVMMMMMMMIRDEILAVPVARCGVAASCSACVQLQVSSSSSVSSSLKFHYYPIIIIIIITVITASIAIIVTIIILVIIAIIIIIIVIIVIIIIPSSSHHHHCHHRNFRIYLCYRTLTVVGTLCLPSVSVITHSTHSKASISIYSICICNHIFFYIFCVETKVIKQNLTFFASL